jgi:hypothetical protein
MNSELDATRASRKVDLLSPARANTGTAKTNQSVKFAPELV